MGFGTNQISMQICDNYDYIIEEKGNTHVSLRKIQWSANAPVKIDLRKYMVNSDGESVPGKGVCITDDGADELTKVLCQTGYGKTGDILDAIKDREDFLPELKSKLSGNEKDNISDIVDMDAIEDIKNEVGFYDIRSELE